MARLIRTRTTSASGHYRMRVYEDDIRRSGASEVVLIFHHVRRAWVVPVAEWRTSKPSGVYSYDDIRSIFGKREVAYTVLIDEVRADPRPGRRRP